MEAKEFEKFYSLCERTVSRQRLLGADNKDIAFVLTGMMATLPEEEYSLEQIEKLRDLSIKKESQKETERIIPEEELQLYLERAKDAMTEQYGKDTANQILQNVFRLAQMSEEELEKEFDEKKEFMKRFEKFFNPGGTL